MRARWTCAVASLVTLLGLLDLALRMVARRGLLQLVLGVADLDPAAVLIVTLASAAVGAIAARRAGMRLDAAVLAAAMACGLVTERTLGARLQSDGFYYYAYLRSLAFDGDFDLTNDYRLLGLDDAQHRFLFQPTVTGHAQSAWSVGPAIAWAPFFAGGHLVARHLARRGENIDTIGTAYPYRQAVVVAGLFYSLLGLWLAFRFACLFCRPRDALAAVALTAAGSFVLWYMVREPTMSHAVSMAASAGFLWCWAADRERRGVRGWLVLGLLGGLMATIRWQNVLLFAFPAADLVRLARADTRRTAIASSLMAGGTIAGFLPQMLAWRALYGQWIAKSPVGPPLHWLNPQILDVLWSSRNGLFAWSPIFVVGLIGLAVLARRQPLVGWGGLALVAAITWVNGAVDDWWGGAGYGMRRFDSVVPLAVLGTAVALEWLERAIARRPQVIVAVALCAMGAWNISLMGIAAGGAFRIGEAISFGEAGGRQVTLLHRWFGHPFSYPVNLAYAARNGVAPWRFDLLRPARFLGDTRRPYGRIDLGRAGDEVYVDGGWYGPEQDGTQPFRWATSAASLLVPLDHTAPLKVQVRLHAFGYTGAPLQRATLVVNGNRYGPVEFGGDWEAIEFQTVTDAWRAGVNRVRLEFEWARRPMDVAASADARSLAAAVAYLRISIP